MAETKKSHERRVREDFYGKYAPPHALGIDIGCQHDHVHPGRDNWRRYDWIFNREDDAQTCANLADESFEVVWASHVLEHMKNPSVAIQNWWRILKPGGTMVINVPSKWLYEKRNEPPSRWNGEHYTFWLLDREEPPFTRSLFKEVTENTPGGELLLLRVLDEGWVSNGPDVHSGGEYSLEAVVRKLS